MNPFQEFWYIISPFHHQESKRIFNRDREIEQAAQIAHAAVIKEKKPNTQKLIAVLEYVVKYSENQKLKYYLTHNKQEWNSLKLSKQTKRLVLAVAAIE